MQRAPRDAAIALALETYRMDTAAIRRAAAEEAPRHSRLIRRARAGANLRKIMLPFLRIWAPPGWGVLTYRGRKTGTTRRKCLPAIRDGDRIYLLMLRPPAVAAERPDVVAAWVHNVRANPRVSIGSAVEP